MIWKKLNKVAKCPNCWHPHPYVEAVFPIENDRGFWQLPCRKCGADFAIQLSNPRESAPSEAYDVRDRIEEPTDRVPANLTSEVLLHNLEPNAVVHRFRYGETRLYLCEISGADLEMAAQEVLQAHFKDIARQHHDAINYGLAQHLPPLEHIVIHCNVPCECGRKHQATFYCKFILNFCALPQTEEEYLLADISGTNLSDRLEGLLTKKEVMTLLEKLLIRWHLTSDQIIVASPFVGHSYLEPEKRLSLFSWILSNLDPDRSLFITRTRTITEYKAALQTVDQVDSKVLAEFGLENKLVAAETRKQDFHAKFFIGRSGSTCEVLSGSANLVEGPSLENVSFRTMSNERCEDRYLNRLSIGIPAPKPRPKHFMNVWNDAGVWKVFHAEGGRLPG
jgi:hypothetical protein